MLLSPPPPNETELADRWQGPPPPRPPPPQRGGGGGAFTSDGLPGIVEKATAVCGGPLAPLTPYRLKHFASCKYLTLLPAAGGAFKVDLTTEVTADTFFVFHTLDQATRIVDSSSRAQPKAAPMAQGPKTEFKVPKEPKVEAESEGGLADRAVGVE